MKNKRLIVANRSAWGGTRERCPRDGEIKDSTVFYKERCANWFVTRSGVHRSFLKRQQYGASDRKGRKNNSSSGAGVGLRGCGGGGGGGGGLDSSRLGG